MLFVLACPKCCGRDLRPSRIRNLGEILLLPVAVPYRCRLCDHRELVVRFAIPKNKNEFEPESNDDLQEPIAGDTHLAGVHLADGAHLAENGAGQMPEVTSETGAHRERSAKT